MESSGFFLAKKIDGKWDKEYLPAEFAEFFSTYVSDGVFAGNENELQVVESEVPDMGVNLSTGRAQTKGYWYKNSAKRYFPVDPADGLLSRIDIIVVRTSITDERQTVSYYLKGEPSLNPVPPPYIRDVGTHDLKLCEVHVDAGVVKITQDNIVDFRANKEACGFVANVVDTINWEQFAAQFNAWFEIKKALWEEWWAGQQGGIEGYMLQNTYDPLKSGKVLFANKSDDAQEHIAKKDNPHVVTKAQVGLSNVNNVAALPLTGGTVTGVTSFNAGLTASSSVGLGRGPGYYGLSKSSFKTYLCTNVPFSVLDTQAENEMPIECSYLDSYDGNQSWRFGGYNALLNSLFSNGISTVLATAFAFRIMNRAAATYMPAYASAFTPASSKRFKENIKSLTESDALKILYLTPVSYTLKNSVDADGNEQKANEAMDEDGNIYELTPEREFGLIAEDVAEIIPEVVHYNEKGEPEALNYMELIAHLIYVAKYQQTQINELKQKLEG